MTYCRLQRCIGIAKATEEGRITLSVAWFMRGVDYVVYNKQLKDSGMHVILSFWPPKRERIQAKGRTARQGCGGSFQIILNKRELAEEFGIDEHYISAMRRNNRLYEGLDERSAAVFDAQFREFTQGSDERNEMHDKSIFFLNALTSPRSRDVPEDLKHELVELNTSLEVGPVQSRTVILLDGTGSMSNLMAQCKSKIQTLLEELTTFLVQHNFSSGAFALQLVIYRNYNSDENALLQASTWEQNPIELLQFLNGVTVEGGWSHEAIEIGLWHVNQEIERGETVTQVLLIGDAPANTNGNINDKESVTYKRSETNSRGKGESYWQNTRFSSPTFFQDELETIAAKEVKVNAFFVRQRAEADFRTIAERTGGRCDYLDVQNQDAPNGLKESITREIIRDVGGDELVDTYVAQRPSNA